MVELGPRLKLELVKIEEGIMGGEVLYHSYIAKSKEEVKELKQTAEKKAFLKLSRKKQQDENIKRKLDEKQRHKDELQKKRAALVENEEDNSEPSTIIPKIRPVKATTSSKVNGKVSMKRKEVEAEFDGDAEDEDDDDDGFSDYDISDDEMMPLDDADL